MDNLARNHIITSQLDILDQVFGGTSVVFYTASTEGDFAPDYVSRNIEQVLNISHVSCIRSATFWREHTHADDLTGVLQDFAALPDSGSATREFRLCGDDGDYRWISNEVSIKHDANGTPYLAGCLRDISASKNCAIELANTLKEQDAREHFYKSVLDNIPHRLFWKDRNSVFRGCNLSGARALNLSCACEIIGKSDYDFYEDHQEADYLRINDEQVMDSGQESYHTETSGRESDVWLDVTKVPLRNENGEVYGLLISYEDVSALKKSEMALHKFKRAVEQSPNIIFIADLAGDIEYANPAFLCAYGDGKHNMLNSGPYLPASGHATNVDIQSMWRSITTEKSWSGELPIRTKTGAICWKSISASPILDESGAIINFLVIENDITERKHIEEALAESEANLREITSTVGEGIYVIDENGIITFVNPAATRFLGMDEQQLLGQDVCKLFSCKKQYDKDNPCCLFGRIRQASEFTCNKDGFFVRKDGSRYPVSAIATPVLRDGVYAGAVVAFHDTTEQKFTQRLLSDTLQELRTILDNAQIGVAYLRENRFSWVNRHMESMFGHAASEMLGKPMTSIYAAAEHDIGPIDIYKPLSEGGVHENELLMKRATGETFWCHQRGVAIDPTDPEKGSIWIMLDIDRLKNTENRLKALNETLAQRVDEETRKSLERERLLIQQGRNAAMGEMIGNIAHQWRQPLSTLGLIVQNIQADYHDGSLDEAALGDYVGIAKRAIQRMSCTIDDFRDFFRPNRTQELFSIYQSIHETMQLLAATLKNNGIAIHLAGDRRLKAHGHPNEFSQVILNFLANSKDALVERKVPKGCIDVELSEHDGLCAINIRDNAGGIPEDAIEKIFDPYFTTKQNGTGIGLHMNRTIIEKHMNGSITCRNTRDGAEFAITIPLAKGDIPQKESEVQDG